MDTARVDHDVTRCFVLNLFDLMLMIPIRQSDR